MDISRKQIISALLVIGIVLGVWYCTTAKIVYRTFYSRDERFKIVFYITPMPFGFPGQGGDAFVSAKLMDSEGNVLEKSGDKLCLASHINDDSVIWLGDHVEIYKLIQWNLPPLDEE